MEIVLEKFRSGKLPPRGYLPGDDPLVDQNSVDHPLLSSFSKHRHSRGCVAQHPMESCLSPSPRRQLPGPENFFLMVSQSLIYSTFKDFQDFWEFFFKSSNIFLYIYLGPRLSFNPKLIPRVSNGFCILVFYSFDINWD
jgi:hypothetical protein